MIKKHIEKMNGFSTGEEDSRGPTDQICCLIDENERCRNAAGNASYSKRVQKTVTSRRLKLSIDPQVCVLKCSVHATHKYSLRGIVVPLFTLTLLVRAIFFFSHS